MVGIPAIFRLIDQKYNPTNGYYGSSATGDEAWLATAMDTKGPVSVFIYVDSNFQNYQSG